MGYHVSILRTNGNKQSPILENEIFKIIESSRELSFKEGVLYKNNNFFLKFTDGELWLSNPKKEDLEHMISLATKLNARVRGDELETYRTPTSSYSHPDDITHEEKTNIDMEKMLKTSRRNSHILHICIFGFFLLLVSLQKYFSK